MKFTTQLVAPQIVATLKLAGAIVKFLLKGLKDCVTDMTDVVIVFHK